MTQYLHFQIGHVIAVKTYLTLPSFYSIVVAAALDPPRSQLIASFPNLKPRLSNQ